MLENVSGEQNGRHLRPQDRVWRETIEIADGFLRFEIGTNCIVTVNAPAHVEIKDEFTFEIVHGSAFFDVKTTAVIGVGGQQITVSKASAGFVVPERGGWADMMVTDGVVKAGDEEFFKPRDGIRMFPDGRKLRYRSVENRVAVMLQNVAEVSRSGIVIPEPGVYELSFMTASRGGNFTGRLYEVTWNGVRLGTVTTPSSKWKRMTFPIVVSRANETGTLAFRGLFVTGKEQSSAFIDGVQLRRLSDYAVSSVKPISEGAALELGADAKLELMYDGDVKVSTVRRGGRRVTGVGHVISAETCPDWVKDPGRLCVPQRGMQLLFR